MVVWVSEGRAFRGEGLFRARALRQEQTGGEGGVGQRDGDKTGEQLGAERVGPRRPYGDLGVYSDEDRSRCRVSSGVVVCLPFITIILIDCREQGREQSFSSVTAAVGQVREDSVAWASVVQWPW